jgi:hypothetical protein
MRFLSQIAVIVAALALHVAPAAAQVPDDVARVLAQKLSEADQLVAQQNYARAAGPFAGGLAAGAAGRHVVTLRAGQTYRLVGVCEERCRDLDVRVLDATGAVMAEDRAANAVPVVDVRPPLTGAYMVELDMARCDASPCWYALNVYVR